MKKHQKTNQLTDQEIENILTLLYCITLDVMRELLNNLDKDISKNKRFWEDINKKYGVAIERLKDYASL